MKHTAGPWCAREGPDTAWYIEPVDPTVKPCIVGTTVGGNDEANAKLMAKSPELLQALKDLVALYNNDDGDLTFPQYTVAKQLVDELAK